MTLAERFRPLTTWRALRSLTQERSVRSALFAFTLTRAIILVVFIVTAHVRLEPTTFGGEVNNLSISLTGKAVARKLASTLLVADAKWYLGIASEGYDAGPFALDRQHNWAFFPLYPLLLRPFIRLTGEAAFTAFALSSILFLLALILLHKLAITFGCDEACADRAVFYLAAFPVSYFFSMAMTESLFLFLTVGSFYAARRERWWTAGCLGALASATRVNGIFLLPALLVLYFEQRRSLRPRADILGLFLIPLGLIAFMLYLHFLTGNALAFKDALAMWDRQSGFFLRPLLSFLGHAKELAHSWDFSALNFLSAMLAFTCAFVLIKRREWALALYTLLIVVAPLSSQILQSLTRYVMLAFPIFIVLGTAGRSPRFDQTVRAVFTALLGIMALLFAARFSLAMS
ncbi:MAG: mannosyltransferase family protein [Pyrinomonadaceae bacterium]